MEKYLQKPRHIEMQVLADATGHVVHLGERDCSLQRRHQKVWEEAGSPALNETQRDEIGAVVTRALEKLGYLGAGTVEFLYEDGQFYLHRDEHPPAGGTSGQRGDHRHRHRAPKQPPPLRQCRSSDRAP